MLLECMTSDELVQEYKKDLPEIRMSNMEFDSSNYVSRALQRNSKSDKIYFSRTITTKRNSVYLNVFIYVRDKNASKKANKWKWAVNSIGIVQTSKGLSFIVFFDNTSIAVRFQSHFFQRYKQRFMEVCDWKTRARLMQAKTILDVVSIYISRNCDTALVKTNIKYIDREHIFAPVKDGAMLLQWDGKNVQANTFITKDMFSYHQKRMLNKAEAERENERNAKAVTQFLMELMNNDNVNDNERLNEFN